MNEWKRICPKCFSIIIYRRKSSWCLAKKKNTNCIKCYYLSMRVPLIRNCPNCSVPIHYKSRNGFCASKNKGTFCIRCRNLIKYKKDKLWIRICSCGKKIIYKEKWLLNRAIKNNSITCSACRRIGKFHTDSTKKRISLSKLNHPNKKEISRKMRISAQKRILDRFGICHPNYNLKACEYFDKIEKEKLWDGLYATKNGEFYIKDLGYFVDYYEPNLNVVIEYDEPRHFSKGKLKLKDINRMNDIKTSLQCQFWRYDEKESELKEF